MHKALRQKVQVAKRRESKVQTLAFSKSPGARKERVRMIENRHWYDRDLKGAFVTGNNRDNGAVTVL